VSSKRMRALVGRQRKLIEEENVYGEKVDEDAFLKLLDQAIQEEYERHQVLVALDKGDKSVKDIAAEIKVDPSIVLEHMIILKARAEADFKELIGNTPIFMRVC